MNTKFLTFQTIFGRLTKRNYTIPLLYGGMAPQPPTTAPCIHTYIDQFFKRYFLLHLDALHLMSIRRQTHKFHKKALILLQAIEKITH